MKVTLLTINAKYVHSSLSAWFLAGGVAKYSRQSHDVSITEATINQNTDYILGQVVSQKPQLIGVSVYIWNADKLTGLLSLLRQRFPDTMIVLGGPEASYNAEYWLRNGADYVLRGEGEHSFPALLDAIDENETEALDNISGLCFRKNGETQMNPPQKSPGEHINPYSDKYFHALQGRIAYIEASRGCPFSCAYCLSGGSSVTFFPLDTVKEQIFRLSNSKTKTIKFVDRTFNCNSDRAYEILKYIISLKTDCCFHFEVAADLFDEKTLSLLNTAPFGKIQLEIGLQSFHKPTLDAVSRKTDLNKAEENIKQILLQGNIHVHVDLIAGLNLETLTIFRESFNRAYALGAHTLQLGFLKLLHGSRLREQAEILGIVYHDEPPYEIINSPWLSENDLQILKRTENALQHTYNKGRFLSALQYALSVSKTQPFNLFRGLGDVTQNHATPLEVYAEQVYRYFSELPNVCEDELKDRMICDMLSMTKGKNMPVFLRSRGEKRKMTVKAAQRHLGRVIDYDETAVLSSGKGVYADSLNRDSVTGLYKLHFID